LISQVVSQVEWVSSSDYRLSVLALERRHFVPLWPQIHDNPVTLQRDIDRRTHSPASNAFFQNQQQLETVTKVSAGIASGQPFRVPPRGGDPTYSSSSLPFHWVAPETPFRNIQDLDRPPRKPTPSHPSQEHRIRERWVFGPHASTSTMATERVPLDRAFGQAQRPNG